MFEVTEKDLVGELAGFPIEVVSAMIMNQVAQGNAPNVQRFQNEPRAAVDGGGFTWSDTVDGHEFWSRVIGDRKWHVFFDRYPSAIEMPSIKKAKTLKAPRKLHFTKAQKWCLERIRLNTGTIHNRLTTILNANLCSTPHFDFPILTGEVDDALKLLCLNGYDSESLESKTSALRGRIIETLTSIYYMNQAFMSDNVHGTVRIWGEKAVGVRSALNWAKKHYALLDKLNHIRFGDGVHCYTAMDVVGKVSVIPSNYKYDKSLGAYRQGSFGDSYILGDMLIQIS